MLTILMVKAGQNGYGCYEASPCLVRKRGLEPPRPCGHYPLKVARLPVPPLARVRSF